MVDPAFVTWTLSQEARALLTRLARVKPFALHETMVLAAALSFRAQAAIENYLLEQRRELRGQILRYLGWLKCPEARRSSPAEAHKRFVFLRLRFNSVLSHFDIFSEAMSQRSENETGVWLSGLDVVSEDALRLDGFLDPPPVVCYLARGPGAAIRRAHTRLPGGGDNPVALVRIPRERMIGSGIASSLVHEVGHQGAALLGLVPSLRAAIQETPTRSVLEETVWGLWDRWISEIVADLWSVSRVGVTASTGLIGVVSLPRAFVFRSNDDDPHPTPWVRVKLSAALGGALYPHPQWARLADLWESFYPLDGLDDGRIELLRALERSMPQFIELLLDHRPSSLRGATLAEVMAAAERQPERLMALYRTWRQFPEQMRGARPSLAFAVVGQAKAEGMVSPEEEGDLLAELLKHWALRSSLDAMARCAVPLSAMAAGERPHSPRLVLN
jgi:hypothetical protein